MPSLSLPSRLPMQKFTLVRREELFSCRVCCSYVGCDWSCPARDVDDAMEILADHLTVDHRPKQEH